MLQIAKLSEKSIKKNIKKLIEIDKVIDDLIENWEAEHFLKNLPGKWEFSFGVYYKKNIIGFGICSIKDDLYIHRFAIDKKFQKNGFGTKLLNRIIHETKKANINSITLQVPINNFRAQSFYNKSGFKKFGINGRWYIFRRHIR